MNDEPNLLKELNTSQYKAVTTTEGPLLVLAGAGSGKTRVITYRIFYLLKVKKVKPSNILAVTFTNKAANEMKERIYELMGKKIKYLTISTFHSLGVKILKQHIKLLKYKDNFNIYDDNDRKNLLKNILKDLKIDDNTLNLNYILTIISLAKNSDNPNKYIENIESDDFRLLIKKLYPLYNQALKNYNAVDFDDLIILPIKILKKFSEIREEYRNKFKYIMVDEYQDTNPGQYKFLKLLLNKDNNICVVGDDDQAIYGFRGSEVEHILRFEKDFPDAKVITLEYNYRSTKNILNGAESLIKNNKKRHIKFIKTPNPEGNKILLFEAQSEKEEAQFIIDKILTYKMEYNYKWSDFAILYRTNFQSRIYEEALRFKNIPYRVIGGMQFYDRKEIKDILSYLKVIVNPKDEISLLRIINYPRRGIGDKSIGVINKYSIEKNISLFEVLDNIEEVEGIKENIKGKIIEFYDLIKKYQYEFNKTSQPLYLIVYNLVKEIGYEEALLEEFNDIKKVKKRMYYINELIGSIKSFEEEEKEIGEKPAIYNYLNKISLMTKDDDKNDNDNKVSLMTFHLSKGLEFEVVFLAGAEDDSIPHQRSIEEGSSVEEERRLFYVGMTRAKKILLITCSRNRKRFNEEEKKSPSRFIKEIDKKYIITSEEEIVNEEEIAHKALEKLKSIANKSKEEISA